MSARTSNLPSHEQRDIAVQRIAIILSAAPLSLFLHLDASGAPAVKPSGKLELHVIDVGQGDGMLLQCPDGKIGAVIDSGDPREGARGAKAFKKYVESKLAPGGKIDLVVAGRPHADHIGAMDRVLKTYKVGFLVDNGECASTATYQRYETLRDRLDAGGRYGIATNDPTEVSICGSKVKVTCWTAGGSSATIALLTRTYVVSLHGAISEDRAFY